MTYFFLQFHGDKIFLFSRTNFKWTPYEKLSTLFLLVFSVFTQAQTIQSTSTIISAHLLPMIMWRWCLILHFQVEDVMLKIFSIHQTAVQSWHSHFTVWGHHIHLLYEGYSRPRCIAGRNIHHQNNLMIGNGITGICSAYVQMDQRDLNFTVTQGTGIAEVAISIPQLLFDASTHTLSLKASTTTTIVWSFWHHRKSVFANTVSSGRINYPGTLTKGIYIYFYSCGRQTSFSGKIWLTNVHDFKTSKDSSSMFLFCQFVFFHKFV